MSVTRNQLDGLPDILSGSVKVAVEANNRLSLPSKWREPFADKSARLVLSRMGEITYRMLFPEDNFRSILDCLDSQDCGVLLRSADPIKMDEQHRLVLPGFNTTGSSLDTVIYGYGSHLRIVPVAVAGDLFADDPLRIHDIFAN